MKKTGGKTGAKQKSGGPWPTQALLRIATDYKSQNLIFAKHFLRPRRSGAHGTSHTCHTPDTPLVIEQTRQVLNRLMFIASIL